MDAPVQGLSQRPKAAPKTPKQKDKRKHGIAKHVIHHHADGTHHIEKHMIGGGEPTVYGAQDLDGVHDRLEENLNGPPSEQEMAQLHME